VVKTMNQCQLRLTGVGFGYSRLLTRKRPCAPAVYLLGAVSTN